jgi:hypothetical protein
MAILIACIIVVAPYAAIIGLLLLADRFEGGRRARLARQVAVTDALHRALGPVVAPVVESSPWRPLRLRIAVPLERPALVARVLAVSREALDMSGGQAAEIVLVPQTARRS